MEIYIAVFAGLLSTVVLAVVYVADRYEREPIDLIQSAFLAGVITQLVLILAVTLVSGPLIWSGGWLLVTAAGVALSMAHHLHRQVEVDERFDGIVYTVAFTAGAGCVIHLNNLPAAIAASPFRAALETGAEPTFRDLLIVAGSPPFAGELGQGLALILVAVVTGAVLGTLQLQGVPPWRSALAGSVVAIGGVALDLAAGGGWMVRLVLATAAVAVAVAVKRRSVFRDRPQPAEGDVLVLGLKTMVMVFGAALLASVLLQAVVDLPTSVDDAVSEGAWSVAGPSNPSEPSEPSEP